MASSWGNSWANSWGNSWGVVGGALAIGRFLLLFRRRRGR